MNQPPLVDVVSEIHSGSRTIPSDRVREWMRTNDIESIGAVYSLITDHFSRIQPPLEFAEYHPFVLGYFQRCLAEDPKGEWAHSRWEAGADIAGWFVWCWRDPLLRASTIPELKEWLATLYIAGDSDIRQCLVQATLEHLFENRAVAEYFSEWTQDPVLSAAYSEAMVWVDGGGRSPYWC